MGNRHRSSHQNKLYDQPSWWGIGVVIFIVIAVICGMMAIILL